MDLGDDLCLLSGTEQCRVIQEKKISSRELVQAVLNRITELNPILNAYCEVSKTALNEADAADKAIFHGKAVGPLHGVPVMIKDLILTKDLRTTFGSSLFSDYIPDEDDVVVERLRHAGAIIIGKTNASEFGYSGVTDNHLFGQTSNPWNINRTAGGSSGGSGAAIAAGMGSFALGSDGGGSVRQPASFNGVYGIKPTFGLVPVYPSCRDPRIPGGSSWESLECIGPMTRTVEDSALLLSVIAGEDLRDRHSLPGKNYDFNQNLQVGIYGLKIAWSPNWGYASVDPEVRQILEKAVRVFSTELGCHVEEANPGFNNPATAFSSIIANESDLSTLRKLNKEQPGLFSQALVSILETEWTAEDFSNSIMERQTVYNKMRIFMDNYDLIITPTMPCTAFELGQHTPSDIAGKTNLEELNDVLAFTFPINMTGQPAASIPVGFTKEGLPVGLQIIGRRFDDATVLQASAAFEKVRPWKNKWPSIAEK
ncbi:amidase [Terrilactibacillus laevilacticus]|uniref:Amidase n=1 Tax=Terrilactibacillus laevilacticus TaxID=1380157 RepID=A0ABW5PRN6_9BACI|nr:amidase family protein [Terrilactibacillus laevilacticus]